ncbi:uracil-DNA glycosylase family protein [Lyngbya sp. PCC 8106]|uniref:uracil-DNA glycosylase n=1 Tax=Lyngbya sp. (strain PCC 8106) TaxID=313612 RepID=UPI0000EACA00|nr:uracil-DNA glycosylase [Lyngbya sp. PCC 8106]EAW37958.1 Phage SPO1 DNA polymerase-related protein [Lyngbya sp. PCC 8106]
MSGDQQLNLFDFDESGATPTPSHFNRDQIPQDVQVQIPPETYQNLDEIADHCNQCHRCVLGNNRTHAVIGRGNLQAAIMIIGEAPGKNEDEQGLPFVGRSGQLLDKILESVGLSTEREVYISNAIRCRPPENRTPTAAEIEACKPYLLEQIRLVDPQIILLTGATAVKSLLAEKQGITKIRGEWRQWEGRLCMPIFHPAYLLRNPSLEPGKPKWLMWEDIKKVRNKYDEFMQQQDSKSVQNKT